MRLKILFSIIISSICISQELLTKYEFEFLEENIFVPCENYPDKFIDKMFQLNTLNLSKTMEGSLLATGYTVLLHVEEGPLKLSIETYKKIRGTWQPTIYNLFRSDLCAAVFGELEVWHNYLKATPEEQCTCPFVLGQKIDFDVSEPTSFSIPSSNDEGEYMAHIHVGTKADDYFLCTDVFMRVYKL